MLLPSATSSELFEGLKDRKAAHRLTFFLSLELVFFFSCFYYGRLDRKVSKLKG